MLNRSAAPAAESLSAPTTTSSTSQGTQRYAVRRPPAASGKQQAEVLRVVEVTARIQQRVTGLVGGQRVLAEQFHTERPAGTDGYCASTPPKLALYMPGAGLTMKPPPPSKVHASALFCTHNGSRYQVRPFPSSRRALPVANSAMGNIPTCNPPSSRCTERYLMPSSISPRPVEVAPWFGRSTPSAPRCGTGYSARCRGCTRSRGR